MDFIKSDSYTVKVSKTIERAREINQSTLTTKLPLLFSCQQSAKQWMSAEDYQVLLEASGGEVNRV